MAMADGICNPAAKPRIKRIPQMTQKKEVRLNNKRIRPIPNMDMIRDPLWLTLEDRNPEQIWETKKPSDIMRKSDPAWPCEIPKSCSIVGMRGAKINRPKKDRKKSAEIKSMLPRLALKDSGRGHSLSVTYESTITPSHCGL